MKRVQRITDRVNNYNIVIPVEGRFDFNKKRYDVVKPGDTLFTSTQRKIIDSYYLPKELSIKVDDCPNYIVRLEGEYVTSGEPLAERLVNGGLTLKRVFALGEGILSFDRLDNGYLDIIGETDTAEFVSPIHGKILDIDINKGITIETSALILSGFNNRKRDNSEINTGTFKFVGSGESVYVDKDLEERYDNMIVFAGKYLYPKLLTDLYSRGALHVITYSMDYSDFREISSYITVLGGFGNISFPTMWYEALKELNGSYASVVVGNGFSKIAFADVGQYKKDLEGKVVTNLVNRLRVGMNVRIRDSQAVNLIGKVAQISEEEDYVLVEINDGRKILINTSAVDIISY